MCAGCGVHALVCVVITQPAGAQGELLYLAVVWYLVGWCWVGRTWLVPLQLAAHSRCLLCALRHSRACLLATPVDRERRPQSSCCWSASITSRRSAWCRSHTSMLLQLKERVERELKGSCCVGVGQWLAAPSCHRHMDRCCLYTHACCGACPASGNWGVWNHPRDKTQLRSYGRCTRGPCLVACIPG